MLSSVGEVEVEAPESSAANVCVVARLITENQDYTHIRTYTHQCYTKSDSLASHKPYVLLSSHPHPYTLTSTPSHLTSIPSHPHILTSTHPHPHIYHQPAHVLSCLCVCITNTLPNGLLQQLQLSANTDYVYTLVSRSHVREKHITDNTGICM